MKTTRVRIIFPRKKVAVKSKKLDLKDKISIASSILNIMVIIAALIIAGLAYFLYNISPLEDREAYHQKKETVKNHLQIGQHLLDLGYYKLAEKEYDFTLKLEPHNIKAVLGKKKSMLLKYCNEAVIDPNTALCFVVYFKKHDHNMLLFLGRIKERLGDYEEAEKYYRLALLNYNKNNFLIGYFDAMDRLSWLLLKNNKYYEVLKLSENMIKVSEYDYRSYIHQLYVVYEQSIQTKQSDVHYNYNNISKSCNYVKNINKLVPKRIGVLISVGEAIRLFNPEISINLFEKAHQILFDDSLYELQKDDRLEIVFCEKRSKAIIIKSRENFNSLIHYEKAINYHCLCKIYGNKNKWRKEINKNISLAQKDHENRELYLYYKDQISFYNKLINNKNFKLFRKICSQVADNN